MNLLMFFQNHQASVGFTIDQVRAAFQSSAAYKANVVIINCGTNDGGLQIDIPHAGDRVRALVNDIWATNGMANTCVMLSTILPTTNPITSVNRITMNEQYRQLVAELYTAGKCIYLAEMDPSGDASGWIDANNDLIDGTHPTVC